jgi:hypothetical protein
MKNWKKFVVSLLALLIALTPVPAIAADLNVYPVIPAGGLPMPYPNCGVIYNADNTFHAFYCEFLEVSDSGEILSGEFAGKKVHVGQQPGDFRRMLRVRPIGLTAPGLGNCGVVYRPNGEFSAIYCADLFTDRSGNILYGEPELIGDYVLLGRAPGDFRPVR